MLVIYRELPEHPTDTPELADHLAHCADCKGAYAQGQFIRERIRSMPQIDPDPGAHHKLMQALAAEHVRFLQRTPVSTSSTPTPAFLAPYLKDLAKQSSRADSLVAFSTADTGPLPIVRASHAARTRRFRQTNHIAIIGLAAAFIVVVMIGGLVSQLFLANQGQQVTTLPSNQVAASVSQPAQAEFVPTVTQTLYPHIASASTNNDTIYYSAYNDANTSWMLEKFVPSSDANATPESIPLLAVPSTRPLIVLGSNKNWLLWLQMEPAKKVTSKQKSITPAQPSKPGNLEGQWSLKALYLGPALVAQEPTSNKTANTDPLHALVLYTGTFQPTTAPNWVNTPIQGVDFYHDHALVAFIDSKGSSHLINYQFDQDKLTKTSEIANVKDRHVLTSPTATSDGNNIYWSEEWLTPEQELKSTIWTQQMVEAQPAKTGRWTPHVQAHTYAYRSDGNSFSPQIVNDTLFMVSKNSNTVQVQPTAVSTSLSTVQPTTTTTAQATATSTLTPQDISQLLGSPTAVDPTIRTQQIDEQVSGKLLAFTAKGDDVKTTTINDDEIVTGLHSGGTFLIWQSLLKGMEMYDARTNVMVNGINSIGKDAAFISVSDTNVVWAKYTAPTGNTNASTPATETMVTFNTLKWPK